MKASILRSLTPFTTSDLDSKGLVILCKVINAIYLISAIVSIVVLGISNPWGFGHVPTAVVGLCVYVFVGVIFQLLRNASIEENENKYYNLYVNIENHIVEEQDAPASYLQLEQGQRPASGKAGRKTLKKDESPFVNAAFERAFNDVMNNLPDGKMNSVEGRGLIKALSLNYDVAIIKNTASDAALTRWILRTHLSKFDNVKEASVKTAQNYEGYVDKWKEIISKILFSLHN